MKRWRVRRFVTVGLFSFSRLVMYHDPDPERWPEQKALHRHPVLVELLGGSDRSQALYAADYEGDRPQIAAKVPLLITDADASQFSAIVDVMDGKRLAIKGPPGTGKSQTITNIIAAALAKGLTALASYHSAKSARDRDRLCQEILEQKGWRLYRIWSTDWFNDPERELA
jgi:hypothetical protein